jgi:pimeloyl-[acyl-carrier protein] methyl ester esterase
VKLVLLAGLDGTGQLFQPLLENLPSTIEPKVISYPTDIFLNYVELESYVQKQCPKDEPFVLLAESF